MATILSKLFKGSSVFVTCHFELSFEFRHLQYNFKKCHYFEDILSFCFYICTVYYY